MVLVGGWLWLMDDLCLVHCGWWLVVDGGPLWLVAVFWLWWWLVHGGWLSLAG